MKTFTICALTLVLLIGILTPIALAQHTYTLENSGCTPANRPYTDNALFTISGSQLQTNAIIDYETTQTCTICVRTTDSGSLTYDEEFVITINDLNPEMDVQGGSPLVSIIGNGTNTPQTSDGTDFGSADITGETVDHAFTIANSGGDRLILDGVPLVGGTNAGDFTITIDPATPVASGNGTTTFTVRFDPSAIGTRSAVISIENDDPDEDPYTFNIQGNGIAPNLLIDSITP
ncbi:MAG: choice-of-anchor D domain-containing protein, partial [Planctomycetes bacterium]|nr:choice-of-anchor D domain-containing protein [Planctomycetota bacterium]